METADLNPDWTPRPFDIEWTKNWLSQLKDGAVWGIPRNESLWRHDAKAKRLQCIHGPKDGMFRAVTLVCSKIGYTTEYAPQDMAPAEVKKHMEATALTADMFGSGKSRVATQYTGTKRYLWQPLTPELLAAIRKNLTKLPKHMRWKGKPNPQCDFCSDDNPTVHYAAHRLTSGEVKDCWRWLACARCHDDITANDFKSIERRIAIAMSLNRDEAFSAKAAMLCFFADAIEL